MGVTQPRLFGGPWSPPLILHLNENEPVSTKCAIKPPNTTAGDKLHLDRTAA